MVGLGLLLVFWVRVFGGWLKRVFFNTGRLTFLGILRVFFRRGRFWGLVLFFMFLVFLESCVRGRV